ncbi:hypothetical protein AB5L52_18750 [Streptomyces sp. CG4]|uniref:hypothetical protein n=1 Tax=Streptomyces sp. CG4 TaxID=408783 RepID=UPI0034E19F7E
MTLAVTVFTPTIVLAVLFLGGWTLCWITTLPATVMWHAPELLKRDPGPMPGQAKGFPGYLLRNAHKGVIDSSVPLAFARPAPPVHFWLVALLNSAVTGFTLYSQYTGSTFISKAAWVPALLWIGFAASGASLAVLIHGSVTRRRAARKASGKNEQAADGHR